VRPWRSGQRRLPAAPKPPRRDDSGDIRPRVAGEWTVAAGPTAPRRGFNECDPADRAQECSRLVDDIESTREASRILVHDRDPVGQDRARDGQPLREVLGEVKYGSVKIETPRR